MLVTLNMQNYSSTVSIQSLFVAVQKFRRSTMIPNNIVVWLVLVIAFDFKCSGKSVANNSPDLFPIQKLAKISATCEYNPYSIFEYNKNLDYAIDGDPNTFWRGMALAYEDTFLDVDITFNFDQVNLLQKKILITLVAFKHISCSLHFDQF